MCVCGHVCMCVSMCTHACTNVHCVYTCFHAYMCILWSIDACVQHTTISRELLQVSKFANMVKCLGTETITKIARAGPQNKVQYHCLSPSVVDWKSPL